MVFPITLSMAEEPLHLVVERGVEDRSQPARRPVLFFQGAHIFLAQRRNVASRFLSQVLSSPILLN